jgi:tetratricopeptide (TPR) repeat protein
MDSWGPAPEPGGSLRAGVRPVRSGAVPALADGFNARLETAAGLAGALAPGGTMVLVPGRTAGKESLGWVEASGKTQLAVCAAESLWRSGEVELLVWIVATSRASVLSGYVEAAVDAMGTDPAGDAEAVAVRFVSWLGESGRPWLVVLDDLSDPANLDGLWPAGPAGRVLVTTANPAFAAEQGALVQPVGAFSPREALSYLMGRLTADPDQRIGAIDLVQDLGYEPMALAQASAVIASSALSCRDYLDYYLHRRDQLAQMADGEPPPGWVTWAISVEQTDRLSPGGAAQALLALTALLDGHGIPGTVFGTPAACRYLAGGGTSGNGAVGPADRERAQGALLVAERTGLLATDLASAAPMVRMSTVVQAALRAAMPDGLLERAGRAAADALLQAWPEDDQPAWLTEVLRSCAASVQRAAGDLLWAGGCHPLLVRAGRSLDSARLTGPAVAFWRDLAAACDRALGRGHPDTLVAGEHLGTAYLAAGRGAEAVPWFRWVLAERFRVLGLDHPGTVTARHNLGHALVAAKQFADAVTVLDGVVSDYARTRGADHLETLDARDELAAAVLAAGQSDEAVRLYRRTLTDRERAQGPQHPDVMTTRQKLADTYLANGKVKNALSQYKQVLSDRERVLGPDHLDTIAVRGSLGSAYHTAGRMAPALQLFERTRASYELALGADHPDTLASSTRLAHAYYAVGRVTDAVTLLRDTATRTERVLPPGDPLREAVRKSLTNIAGG